MLSSFTSRSVCFELGFLGAECRGVLLQSSRGRGNLWNLGVGGQLGRHSHAHLKIPGSPGFRNKPWHSGDTWPHEQQWRERAGPGHPLTWHAARADEYVLVLSWCCDWNVVFHGETLLQMMQMLSSQVQILGIMLKWFVFYSSIQHCETCAWSQSYWLNLQNS